MLQNRQVFRPGKVQDEALSTNGARIGGNTAFRYIVPDNGASPSFNGEVTYKLKSFGDDLIRDCYLKFTVSALTASVGAAEWSNMLAINLWDRIEIRSGGHAVHQLRSDSAMQTIKKIYDKTHYDNVIAPMIADLSEADRQTAAGGSQDLYFPIGKYFSMLSAAFPVYLLNERDTEIKVYLRPLSKCVINGESASISDVRAELCYTDPGHVFTSTIKRIVKDNKVLKSRGRYEPGWHLQSNWYDKQDASIPSGVSEYQIHLPSLANQWVKSIHFTIHANSDLANGIYDNFIAVDRFSLKSGGAYLSMQDIDTTSGYYDNVILEQRKVPGRANIRGSNIYGIYYTDAFYAEFSGDTKRANAGSHDFSGVKDAQLTLNFSSALGSAHTCVVTIVRHQEEVVHNGAIKSLGTRV